MVFGKKALFELRRRLDSLSMLGRELGANDSEQELDTIELMLGNIDRAKSILEDQFERLSK